MDSIMDGIWLIFDNSEAVRIWMDDIFSLLHF
jgi:hypothetical protein